MRVTCRLFITQVCLVVSQLSLDIVENSRKPSPLQSFPSITWAWTFSLSPNNVLSDSYRVGTAANSTSRNLPCEAIYIFPGTCGRRLVQEGLVPGFQCGDKRTFRPPDENRRIRISPNWHWGNGLAVTLTGYGRQPFRSPWAHGLEALRSLGGIAVR